jgi:hypothetical protein
MAPLVAASRADFDLVSLLDAGGVSFRRTGGRRECDQRRYSDGRTSC